MRDYIKYLLSLPIVLSLIQVVSATEGSIGSTLTGMGPLNLQVSLGIENFPGMSVTQAYFVYRWITFIAVAWVALSADKKSATMFGVLSVIVAAMCAYAGWFTVLLPNGNINPAGPWSIIILLAVLTVLSYITETKRLNFGIASAGDPVVNIFVFIVIFNSCLGLMSSTAIFANMPGMATTPPVCTTNSYANCVVNGGVQLQTISATSTNPGGILGIFSNVWDGVTQGASVAYQGILLILSMALSLVFVAGTITATFPWILSSPPAMAVIGILQIFIYVIYALMAARVFGKTMPGELRL